MTNLEEVINKAVEKSVKEAILAAHPVGSFYFSDNDINPAEVFGGGVTQWTRLTDRVLIGAGDSYSVGSEGGEATHVLSEAELPSLSGKLYMPVPGYHGNYCSGIVKSASRTDNPPLTPTPSLAESGTTQWGYEWKFGSGQAHNNLQPYRAVYIWRRTK